MDGLDKRILYALAENAYESRNKIAKSLRCSREVLDYRIKKLQESGIIVGYQARINLSNFIYGGYVLLIQSSGLTKDIEAKIVVRLKAEKCFHYFGKIVGEYDFIVGFSVKNINEVSLVIEKINQIFGKYKNKLTFLTMVKEYKDSFKSLFGKNDELNKFVSMHFTEEKISMDEIDKQILILLGENCFRPSWDVAEKVKITDVAVRKRIDKLVKNKIILNFRTMINLTKLNYQSYFLLLKVNSSGRKVENKLICFLRNSRKVTYATRFIGEYDYVINISVENTLELRDFISYFKEQFPDLITEIIPCPLFEMFSHEYITSDFLSI